MTSFDYDKLTDPVTDILETCKALLLGSFGPMMGDQREGLNRIYAHAGGVYTLFMDVITAIGIEKMAQRGYLREKFRSLLNPIQARSQALLDEVDGPLGEEQVIGVQYIRDCAVMLLDFSDRLWLYSRILTGQVHSHPTGIDLTQLLSPMDFPLTHKPIDLHFELLPGLPPVYADRDLLKICVHELIRNAMTFTNKGEIHIRSRHRPPHVDVLVEDSGKGINVIYHERLFEPFYQVQDAGDRLGLGLFIVKSLMEKQGGLINLASSPGRGAVFTLSLPMQTD